MATSPVKTTRISPETCSGNEDGCNGHGEEGRRPGERNLANSTFEKVGAEVWPPGEPQEKVTTFVILFVLSGRSWGAGRIRRSAAQSVEPRKRDCNTATRRTHNPGRDEFMNDFVGVVGLSREDSPSFELSVVSPRSMSTRSVSFQEDDTPKSMASMMMAAARSYFTAGGRTGSLRGTAVEDKLEGYGADLLAIKLGHLPLPSTFVLDPRWPVMRKWFGLTTVLLLTSHSAAAARLRQKPILFFVARSITCPGLA